MTRLSDADWILEAVVVTARRIEEIAQEVPIPIAVITARQIENAGAFNVNRLQQVAPTIQFYTTNQRNSFLNIRGLGLPFGLANDGIEVGVGMYVDGVFHSRPAAATLCEAFCDEPVGDTGRWRE